MVAALRDRDPDAVRMVYDTYGESLFQYCWLVLRSREAAQAAVREALVVAREQIDRLRDPVWLRAWLYTLAHAECRRRHPVPPADADEPPAQPGQSDAGRRTLAWTIVAGMSQDHAEILDLTTRHGMELSEAALALGISEREALELAEAAEFELRDCLGAELVVRRGDPACQGRTAALQGWTGAMTVAFRARVLDHASGCEACGRHLPSAVSADRVYGYIPVVTPGPRSYDEMLDWLAGERTPAAPADAASAPVVRGEPAPRTANQRVTRARILLGAAVVLAAVAAAAALILGGLPGSGGGHGQGSGMGRISLTR